MSLLESYNNSVLRCARGCYSKVLSATTGAHRKIVIMWMKDIGYPGPQFRVVDTTSYYDVTSLQPGINVVIDKIIQERLITHNPSRGNIIYIFVLEIGEAISFTIAKNISRRCRPDDLPLSQVWIVSFPE